MSGYDCGQSTYPSLTGPVSTVGVISTPGKSGLSFFPLPLDEIGSLLAGGNGLALSSAAVSDSLKLADWIFLFRSLICDVPYVRF